MSNQTKMRFVCIHVAQTCLRSPETHACDGLVCPARDNRESAAHVEDGGKVEARRQRVDGEGLRKELGGRIKGTIEHLE